MRKFFPLVLCLLVLSSMVFALGVEIGGIEFDFDTGDYYDGIKVHFASGIGYVNNFDRPEDPVHLDKDNPDEISPMALTVSPWSQQAQVSLQAKAYIPCYLGLAVYGNNAGAFVESFGPGAQDSRWNGSADQWLMIFDNEIGGFINNEWEFMDRGRNLEVHPIPDHPLLSDFAVFIEANDTYHAIVYSNDAYTYEVEASALKYADVNAGVKDLPLGMLSRFATTKNPVTLAKDVLDGTIAIDSLEYGVESETTFTGNKTVNFGNRPYCSFTIAEHRFRVPYDLSVRHGEYTGVVTFRAYTI